MSQQSGLGSTKRKGLTKSTTEQSALTQFIRRGEGGRISGLCQRVRNTKYEWINDSNDLCIWIFQVTNHYFYVLSFKNHLVAFVIHFKERKNLRKRITNKKSISFWWMWGHINYRIFSIYILFFISPFSIELALKRGVQSGVWSSVAAREVRRGMHLPWNPHIFMTQS